LADEIRRGAAPAAELILLPDGGELKPEKIDPVLRAFARVHRLERGVERCRHRLADRRSSAASRATVRRDIELAYDRIRATICELPIRPAVVDNVVAGLRNLDRELEAAERMPAGPDRSETSRTLEERAGLPPLRFHQRLAHVGEREQVRPDA